MRYQFISEHEKVWPIWIMCKTLGVSRSAYYRRKCVGVSPLEKKLKRLIHEIKVLFAESKMVYGSPRIHAGLRRRGINCNLNQVAKLMKANGIRSKTKRKFRVTTDSKHNFPVAKNLLNRDFTIKIPNKVWLVDITYIPTAEG